MRKLRLTTENISHIIEYTINGKSCKYAVVINNGNELDVIEYIADFIDLPKEARNFIHNGKKEVFCGYDHISKRAAYRYKK
jgi:hypothetical protein